jgi:tetratricopeptide (TPR) repeat protein
MIYIGKTVWPARLPFFYPYPKAIPVWQAALAGVAILTISAAALFCARRLPWLTVGWFWYFVTLIPVIGLVQVGNQARADRYMYIPMVGLAIIVAWGAASLAERWPRRRIPIVLALSLICAAMIPATWAQVQYWKNNESLFAHAISVSNDNYIAFHNLGLALRLQSGHDQEALAYFDKELKADYNSAEGHTDRGETLMKLGRTAEAVDEYKTAMRLDPHYQEAYVDYGSVLAAQGRSQEAMTEYEKALRINPKNSRALYNRGVALLVLDRIDEAIDSFNQALAVEPDSPETLNDLGAALTKQGRWDAAVGDFDAAVRLRPGFSDAHRNLGQALMKSGRMHDAVQSLRTAVRLNPKDADAHNMLGFTLINSEYVNMNGVQSPQVLAEAVAEVREAVRIDPGLVSAQENLGRLLAQDPATRAEAIAHLEAAVRLQTSPATAAYLDKLKSQGPGR